MNAATEARIAAERTAWEDRELAKAGPVSEHRQERIRRILLTRRSFPPARPDAAVSA